MLADEIATLAMHLATDTILHEVIIYQPSSLVPLKKKTTALGQ